MKGMLIGTSTTCPVDVYDLRCTGGEYTCTLYFDMYHANPPWQPAPVGLTRLGDDRAHTGHAFDDEDSDGDEFLEDPLDLDTLSDEELDALLEGDDDPVPPAVTARHTTSTSPSMPGASGVRDTYGFSASDPILCDMVIGERQFINRLRCSRGHMLRGERRGSTFGSCSAPTEHSSGIGADGRCIVDCYDLTCDGGEYTCTLYFDMYHPGTESQSPPKGLSLLSDAGTTRPSTAARTGLPVGAREDSGRAITLTGADGQTHACELLEVFELDGKSYAILVKSSDGTVTIMRLLVDGRGTTFRTIESDAEFERVVDYVSRLSSGES